MIYNIRVVVITFTFKLNSLIQKIKLIIGMNRQKTLKEKSLLTIPNLRRLSLFVCVDICLKKRRINESLKANKGLCCANIMEQSF
jgi:hypothetical protein